MRLQLELIRIACPDQLPCKAEDGKIQSCYPTPLLCGSSEKLPVRRCITFTLLWFTSTVSYHLLHVLHPCHVLAHIAAWHLLCPLKETSYDLIKDAKNTELSNENC